MIARRLYGNPFAWGVTLIIIGTLFLLHTLLGVQLPIRELFRRACGAWALTWCLITFDAEDVGSNRALRFATATAVSGYRNA